MFMLLKCICVHDKHGKTHGDDLKHLFGQIWLGDVAIMADFVPDQGSKAKCMSSHLGLGTLI